jgi:hypothetical protein
MELRILLSCGSLSELSSEVCRQHEDRALEADVSVEARNVRQPRAQSGEGEQVGGHRTDEAEARPGVNLVDRLIDIAGGRVYLSCRDGSGFPRVEPLVVGKARVADAKSGVSNGGEQRSGRTPAMPSSCWHGNSKSNKALYPYP